MKCQKCKEHRKLAIKEYEGRVYIIYYCVECKIISAKKQRKGLIEELLRSYK